MLTENSVESYRLSSKLNYSGREYLIQSVNDVDRGSVSTTVFVDDIAAEQIDSPHPLNGDAEEILFFVKMTHGQKKAEIERLLRALRRVGAGSDTEEMLRLGDAFFNKGYLREAKELFASVIRLNPANHQAFNYLGMTELLAGDPQKAVAAARQAVALCPHYADYRNNLGEALLACGEPDKASVELEAALDVNVYYADAYLNLGLAHLSQAIGGRTQPMSSDQIARIDDLFHRASLIDSDLRNQRFSMGRRLLKEGAAQDALQLFQTIRQTRKETRRRQASLHPKFLLSPEWASNEMIGARIVHLEEKVKENPSFIDLHLELAECHLVQAKLTWERAVQELREAAEMNPALDQVTSLLPQADRIHDDMEMSLRQLMERG